MDILSDAEVLSGHVLNQNDKFLGLEIRFNKLVERVIKLECEVTRLKAKAKKLK